MNINLDEQKFQEYAEEQVRKSVDRYVQQCSFEIRGMIKSEITRIISKHFSQIIDSEMVYALKMGHVEESGDPDEIYKKGGIYKEIIDASARSLNIEKIARTIEDKNNL